MIRQKDNPKLELYYEDISHTQEGYSISAVKGEETSPAAHHKNPCSIEEEETEREREGNNVSCKGKDVSDINIYDIQ